MADRKFQTSERVSVAFRFGAWEASVRYELWRHLPRATYKGGWRTYDEAHKALYAAGFRNIVKRG